MPENNHSPQTFANHVRYHPIYHFFLLPAITINLGIAIWQATSAPGWASAQQMLVAVILVVVVLLVRTNPLRAQDRIIRLEEQLRFERVLSKEQAARARNLRVGQIVALRFASDDELPQLIESILAGRLSKSAEIKKSIRNWRGDHLRV